MPVNSKNVWVGAPDQETTGAILTGPETDAIPETIDDVVTTGLFDSGYVDEDGVTLGVDESTDTIKDWSLTVVRTILTEFKGTVKWSHLELSTAALKNYMGDDNVTVKAATSSKGTQTRAAIAGNIRPVKAWYFQMKDGDKRALVLVPHGQVTERGEIPLAASGAIKLPVTLSTYPDKAGKNIYVFLDDGVVAA